MPAALLHTNRGENELARRLYLLVDSKEKLSYKAIS